MASNLKKRIISSVLLIPPVLLALYFGGIAFGVMLGMATIVMLWEWARMTRPSRRYVIWWIFGAVYISIPMLSIWDMRQYNAMLLLQLLLCVWATDIGAYVAGKSIGGPKIAPSISPNKTWAGLAGGICASIITMLITQILLERDAIITALPFGAGIAITAQMGDFFESWVKRRFGRKDSSNIIPGHGGMLDRLDGVLSATLAIATARLTGIL